jgi:hypothetical protein
MPYSLQQSAGGTGCCNPATTKNSGCLNMDFSFFTDGRALLFMTIAGIVYYFYLLATDSNE